MVAQTFDPSTQKAESDRSLEFVVSLVYRSSSKTVKTTQRNTVSGGKKSSIHLGKVCNSRVQVPDCEGKDHLFPLRGKYKRC